VQVHIDSSPSAVVQRMGRVRGGLEETAGRGGVADCRASQ
jgi:hypothetical protein